MQHEPNSPFLYQEQRARMYEQMLVPSWRSDAPSALRKAEQARRKAIQRRLAPYWTVPLGLVLLLVYAFGNPVARDFVSRMGWQIDAVIGAVVMAVVMRRYKAGSK